MNNVKVVSLSYIMEDGVWECSVESSGEFKYWSYLLDGEKKDVDVYDVEGLVNEWIDVSGIDEEELKEFGYYEVREKFLKVLSEMELEEIMVNVFEWGMEYDMNISYVVEGV